MSNERVDRMMKLIRVVALVVLDIMLVVFSMLLALWSRMDFSFAALMREGFYGDLVLYAVSLAAFSLVVFIPMKLYSSLWAFAGVEELLRIITAVCIISVAQMIAVGYKLLPFPRSFPILNGLYLVMTISVSRFSYRVLRFLLHQKRGNKNAKRTILIGAGEAGVLVLREFQKSRVIVAIDIK